MAELYVSTDIEADGPIPGPHSMLSLGSAAYLPDKTLVATYSVNLELLPGATSHPDTMGWWKEHPEAWSASRRDLRAPAEAMAEYARWLESLPGKLVFVGYPAAFDFMFVYWYLMRFVGRSPFGFSALDIKTMAMLVQRIEFSEVAKRNMPREWLEDQPREHVALSDAIAQGILFCNVLAAARQLPKEPTR